MPVTSPNNINYPDSTYAVSPLEALFSTMATSIDTSIQTAKQGTTFAVPSQAARTALFPSPVAMNQVFRTDTGQVERYNGSTWQTIEESYTAGATGSSVPLSTSGPLGIGVGLSLASVPWARQVLVFGSALLSIASGSSDIYILRNGNGTNRARTGSSSQSATVIYSEILPANTAATYQLVAQVVSGAASSIPDGTLTYMNLNATAL